MSNHYRLTDPDEMIQYLRDYAAVKQEPTIADAAEMLERAVEDIESMLKDKDVCNYCYPSSGYCDDMDGCYPKWRCMKKGVTRD